MLSSTTQIFSIKSNTNLPSVISKITELQNHIQAAQTCLEELQKMGIDIKMEVEKLLPSEIIPL